MSEETPKKHPNLYKRITASVPLLVTVIVHVFLIAIAGYFVVSEQIIGKKRAFEAVAATESVVQKQVEHRLQVARKGGGSVSTSPVSASRIFSTAENALQMPEMPDLPSVGASSLSGMGFGVGMGAVGTGSGYGTGLGSGSGMGTGFMSMSFLGVTNQKSSKVVFVLDVGTKMMDLKKGGFEAFEIIRKRVNSLVQTQLTPSTSFNVVLVGDGEWDKVMLYSPQMVPALVQNKEDFVRVFSQVNRDVSKIGPRNAAGFKEWTPKNLSSAGLNPRYDPPPWAEGIQAAMEVGADTIFVITGSAGNGRLTLAEAEIARKKAENDRMLADMKRDGLDPAAVEKARNAFTAKALAELRRINAELVAKGKPPLVAAGGTQRIFDADFQAKLRQLGYSIRLDTTGWADKAGKPIWWTGFREDTPAEFSDAQNHLALVRRALVPGNLSINLFYFAEEGDDARVPNNLKDFSSLTSRYGGRSQMLSTAILKRLDGGPDSQ
jgi:hypothetical protein